MSNYPSPSSDIAAERHKYEDLISRLEVESALNPREYQRKLRRLAMLGHGYILLMIAVSLGLVLSVGTVVLLAQSLHPAFLKIGFLLGIFDFFLIKSLFIKFDPPKGLPLTRQEAPKLFAEVDEIGVALKSPKPDFVLLTEEFNAAVIEVPRLGIFGWPRNYLIVGVPLMAALSPEEFKSVLAHELGQLSGKHSRFSTWIYRVRLKWAGVATQLDKHGNWVFGRFTNWYAPYFSAYSFVLIRQHEFEVDRYAAEISGAAVTARALTRRAVAARYLREEWWPNLQARVADEAEPPSGVYRKLSEHFSRPETWDGASRRLSEVVKAASDPEDTHPALGERLEALEQAAEFVPLVGPVALEHYLGRNWHELVAPLEMAWKLSVEDAWRKRHADLLTARKKMGVIESRPEGEELSLEDRWLLAEGTEELGEAEKAFGLYEEFMAQYPEDARGHFAVGRLQLQRGEEAGLEQLTKATELDPSVTVAAAELAQGFLLQENRTQEIRTWRSMARAYQDNLAGAQAERSSFSPKDFLLTPEFSDELRYRMAEHFAKFKDVVEVYVVSKKVEYFPERPYLVGGIVVAATNSDRSGIIERATKDLNVEHLEQWLDLDADGNQEFLGPFREVKDSLIYRREK